jgi:hypothetical protein
MLTFGMTAIAVFCLYRIMQIANESKPLSEDDGGYEID